MASPANHHRAYLAIAVILILGWCARAGAVEFAGGTGEPNDPYQIATAEQLLGISSDRTLADRHFVLVADIDLDPSLPGRKVLDAPVVGWVTQRVRRIQADDDLFHGSFNGGGHVIRNCVLSGIGNMNYGAALIGGIAEEGMVRDLHVENMIVIEQAGFFCATLAAVNYGTVINCSATGTLTAYQVGGLIGRNAGIVARCRADCTVFGDLVGGLIAVNDPTGRVVLCESDGLTYGDYTTGGLIAMNGGTVQCCTAAGCVSGVEAGGLVGNNNGWVRESFTTATMIASQACGGIAYGNYGIITDCYATGSMSAYADGLVAINMWLQSSYSTTPSQVRPSPVGRRSLALGSTTDSSDVAPGELGAQSDMSMTATASGTVRYVYYLDADTPPGPTDNPESGYGVPLSPEEMEQQGSFVGFDFYGDPNDGSADCWFMPPDGYPVLAWQTEVTGLVAVPDVSGLSPEQAAVLLEAAGLEPNGVRYDYARPRLVPPAEEIVAGGIVREVGAEGQVIATQPRGPLPPGSLVDIVVSLGQYDWNDNPGDGSEANPYQIAAAGQLDSLAGQDILAGQHYMLTADIDMSAYAYNGPLIRELAGDFNGNGHAMLGLQTGSPSFPSSGCGLFWRVASSGSLHDLIVDQARVFAPNYAAGVLADENLGRISRCDVTGQVTGGTSYTGGLVGYNSTQGQLTDCRFSGRIAPGQSNAGLVGGLAGGNMGVILRCCARDVDVSGDSYVGGLVGQNGSATGVIEACYATGVIEGIRYVGGLVGGNGIVPMVRRSILIQATDDPSADSTANGVIRRCYAACSVTGQQDVGGCIGLAMIQDAIQESCYFLDPNDGGGPDNGFGTPLTAGQMQQQASFAGWDFAETWTICEGHDYPRLKWETAECEE